MEETLLGFPLTLSQKDIYLDQLRLDGSPLYNIGGYIHLGPVDLDRLRAAHVALVSGHDAFGLRVASGAEGPSQRVVAERTVALPLIDFSSEPNPREAARAWLDHRFQQPFSFIDSELFEARVLRIADDEHWYSVVAHHLLIDGWGFANLAAKLGQYYHADTAEPSVPWEQVAADDADYQQGARFRRDGEYWSSRLPDAPEPLLPAVHRGHRAADGTTGSRETVWIDAERYASLACAADACGAGVQQLMLAALGAYFSTLTGRDRLVIGLPVHNRRSHAAKRSIGVFTGIMPFAVDANGADSMASLLRRIVDGQRADYRHQRYPIGQIARDVGLSGTGQGLYDVCFNYLKLDSRLEIGGHVARLHYLSHHHNTTPLTVTVWEYGAGQPVELHLDYNGEYFSRDEAALLASRLLHVLDQVASDPGRPLAQLDLLAPGERARLDGFARGPRVAVDPDVHVPMLFRQQALRTPTAPALCDATETVDYATLADAASRIASALLGCGVTRGDRVAICAGRSWRTVAAMLGVLGAGAAFVPVEPSLPDERRRYMLDDAGVAAVLSDAPTLSEIAFAGYGTLVLEELLDGSPIASIDRAEPGPDDLAYVIYTSGSTGRPKGVMVDHRALANLVVPRADDMEPRAGDQVLLFSSFSFDASVWDWARALTRGATVHICPEPERQSGDRLGDYLAERRITHALIPPAALAYVDPDRAYALRALTVGGEACDPTLARRWCGRLRMINAYGPTEATVAASQGVVLPDEPITLGRPLPNVALFVMDARGEPAPIGSVGELYIGGAGLARGYLGLPELTAERFLSADRTCVGERLYRSGDRARWTHDGRLEFHGRVDDQVKLRGYRIELGEIENALMRCAGVERAVVVVQGEGAGRFLLAYVQMPQADGAAGNGDAAAGLQATLRRQLPDYMVPSVVVPLARLPVGPLGKVDRRALPAVDAWTSGHGAIPASAIERDIASIWTALLGIETVAVDVSFFAVGGHSLLATRLASEISARTGVAVGLRAIFEHPTVRAQAALVDAGSAGARTIPRCDDARPPLSFAQQRLWLLDRMDGDSTAYHVCAAYRLVGELRTDALATALQGLLARHEPLRTTVGHDGEQTWQCVHDVPEEVLRPLEPAPDCTDDASFEQVLQSIWDAERRQPFDLESDVPLRARLLRWSETDHVLMLTLHHIALDGWSVDIVLRELSERYARAVQSESDTDPALPIRYVDHAAWQRNAVADGLLDASVDYWARQLAGIPVLHGLLPDRPRPARPDARGGAVRRRLPGALVERLQALAGRHDATLFMALQAAFAALVAQWGTETDIAVGVPVSGRQHRDVEALVGFFVNTVVLRSDLSDDPTFAELLGRTRATVLSAFEHQDVPFDHLVERLRPVRSPGHAPLFQIMFALQAQPLPALVLPGLDIQPLDAAMLAPAKFDLDVAAQPCDDGLELTWTFAAALFEPATIERLASSFERFLESVLEDPARSCSALFAPSDQDEARLTAWAGTTADPTPANMLALHRRVECVAREWPDAPAVADGNVTLGYAELERRAERVADVLVVRGIGAECFVGICMARSVDVVAAMLGVLKAGAAFVPLDPGYPDARLQYIVGDTGMPLVLVDDATADRIAAVGAETLRIDDGTASTGNVRPPSGDESGRLAYALYTSGSTGHPKGVLIEHGALSNLLARLSALEVGRRGPGSVWALAASFAFDASLQGLMQLVTGGAIHILPESTKTDAVALRRWLGERGADVIDCTPTLLEYWLGEGLGDCLPDVVVGGEAISPGLWAELVAWQARTGRRAINVYGPTECCVDATWAPVAGEVPVIGRPLGNVRCHVLSPSGQPVPVGAPGELYIGGVAVGRGYWNRPGLTAEKFVADPFEAGGRLYRSGDRVRWRNDGQLEFLGRLDAQVKLRGFRIEPGEIESRLRSHAQVREAAVRVRGEGAQARLVAYVVAQGDTVAATDTADTAHAALIDALKAHAAEGLPAYMQPQAYVVLERLPLTVNGKLDVAALPEPDVQAGGYVAPRTPTEVALAAIWSQVLGREAVGAEDHFFALGGHSLLATRVVSAIARQLDRQVPVRALFEQPVLSQLARWLDGQARQAHAPIPVVDRDGPLPLSFAQQRLWFIEQLDHRRAHYNMTATLRLDGALDVPALQSALDALVARHEVLRTTYAVIDGEPVQCVRPARGVALATVEPADDLAGAHAALQAQLALEASTPFDFSRDLMLRARLARPAPDRYVLILTLSHLAADGWSLSLMAREFAAHYRAAVEHRPAELPSLPIQYADYAVHERSDAVEAQRAADIDYWTTRLDRLPTVHALPLDRARPVEPSYRPRRHTAMLDTALLDRLTRFAHARGATLFMALHAALSALLSRWSGERDIVIGTPVAGRQHPDVESLVGLFVNTLVLRLDVDGAIGFERLLDEARACSLEANAHQSAPFEKLVEALQPERTAAHAPLFQVMLVLQNNERVRLDLPGLVAGPLEPVEERAEFDLQLTVEERPDGLHLEWIAAADLFDAPTVARMADGFRCVIEAALASPETPIAALDLVTPADRADLEAWSNAVPTVHAPHPVHERVSRCALACPDATAIDGPAGSLTYRELDAAANRLAHVLRAQGVGPGQRVALCMARSPRLPVAILAVLKSGAAYVPVDPDYPPERCAYILSDADVALVLTDEGSAERVPHAHVLVLDTPETEALCAAQPAQAPVAAPADAAYVVYTSGSTGRPKGVVVGHAAVSALVDGLQTPYAIGPQDRLLQFAAIGFDVFVEECFMALCHGATLVLRDQAMLAGGAAFWSFVADHGVTVLNLPTAFWATLVDDLRPHDAAASRVRLCIVGGEAASAAKVVRWNRLGACARLLNGYGPTECTVTTTVADLSDFDDASAPVPIGRPLPHVSCHVLDGDGRAVPPGLPGELHLGGPALANGYIGRDDLTAERFITTEHGRLYRTGDRVRWHAGELQYLGRVDEQVKLRGFRVEPGEVEARLRQLEGVADAAVVACRIGDELRLAAYVIPTADADDFDVAALHAPLARVLPDYMVPSAWAVVAAFPLTANGKIDRRALAGAVPVAASSDGYVPPEPGLESRLASLWDEVLQCGPVGRDDDFFRLGGHSLLVVRLIARIRAELQLGVPFALLFSAPRLRDFAGALAALPGSPAKAIERADRSAPLPLSPAQQGLWLTQGVGDVGSAYHIPMALRLRGPLDTTAIRAALQRIVERHEALRTTFVEIDGQAVQCIADADGIEPDWREYDLSASPDADAGLRGLLADESARAFDLARGPLLRACLVRESAARHVLSLTLHHLVADGWSVGVLARELGAFYGACLAGASDPLPELTCQYADAVAWQAARLADDDARHVDYWRQTLADAPVLCELPTDRPRPARQDHRGDRIAWTLDPALSERLRRFSAQAGHTPFMTLLAGWAALMSRLSGQHDVVVGTATANRADGEFAGLIGLFTNTLALRFQAEPGMTTTAWLDHVRRRVLDAHAHEQLPFDRVVAEVSPPRSPAHSPLFQNFFVWQDDAAAHLSLHGIDAAALPEIDNPTAKFDLTLAVLDAGGAFSGTLEFAVALFDRETVAGFLRSWERLLAGMLDAVEPLDALPLLSPEERAGLLEAGRGPDGDREWLPIAERFRRHAMRCPGSPAIVHGDTSVSYAGLDAMASALADRLRVAGVVAGDHVAVEMRRSIPLVAAQLAVLMCGAAYVPLDPDLPPDRRAFLLDDSRAACVLRVSTDGDVLVEARQGVVGADLPRDADAAYVMYTSGSTGVPKGVVVPRRGIERLVVDNGYAAFTADDRVAFASNPAFDASTLEVWAPLLNGGCVVVVDQDVLLDPDAFARLLREARVSVLWMTVGLFNQYAELIGGTLAGLRYLLVGGDALDPPTVSRFLAAHRPGHFLNGYGPTETTTFALTHEVAPLDADGRIPVGRPIACTQAYVLDERMQPLPPGVAGELYIGGAGVALGYLGRDDLGAERFVADPFAADGSRLYRTGDRARWLRSGVVEFLGRVDRQVKIRGFRVEPGEIEACLGRHGRITESAVAIVDDAPGARRIVAYYVADADLAPEEVRAWVAAHMPHYMVPAACVPLDAMPLTANGKLDRRALPVPAPSSTYTAPATPLEAALAEIWETVLGAQRVGRDDDYFERGGNSLTATRIVSEVRRRTGLPLTVRAMFEHPTVRTLAAHLEAHEGSAGTAIVPVDRDGDLPLSFAQQRLWFLDTLQGGSAEYHVPALFRLRGALDEGALQRALDGLVARHEVLRTVYAPGPGDAPVQRIRPAGPVTLRRMTLDDHDDATRASRLAACIAADVAQPFDLARDAMLRGTLVRLAEADHVLLLTLHHIACDGWSLDVLAREFAALYDGAGATLPPLPLQYADYAAWQRRELDGASLAHGLDVWRARLEGAPAVHDLPLDRPRPARQRFEADTVDVVLGPDVLARCEALAQRTGATLFMVLHAALVTLLSRWSGQADLVVATPVSGRQHAGVEGLIGLFVNTVALRSVINGNATFETLVRGSRDVALEAFEHQDVPFDLLVDALGIERSVAHNPLCQIKFVLQNQGTPRLSLRGVEVEAERDPDHRIRFDLDVTGVEAGDGLALHWSYQTALFDRSTVARMADAYVALLDVLSREPSLCLEDFELVSAAAHAPLLSQGTGPDSRVGRAVALVSQVASQARRTPSAVAVRCGAASLTYAQLDAASNRLAHALAEQGVEAGARVGVQLERSPELIVALLAVMKTGAAYVMLDPKQAPARRQAIVADAGIAVVVQAQAVGRGLAGVDALYVDDPEALSAYPSTPVAVEVDLQSSAYVLYTSGSTGVPKGVEVTHAGLVDYCAFARGGYYAEHLAGSLVATSPAFDLTIPALYVPLLAGGCVELVPVEDELAALAARLDGEVGSVLLRLTPSHVQGLLALSDARPRAQAHVFVVGGEAFPVALAQALQGKYPDARVINHYGPTETVVGCCWYDVSAHLASLAQATSLPIGVPMENTRLYVLDAQGRLVPPGVAGELYIGGAGVAKGYLGRAELTAEKFVADPFEAGGRLYRSGDRVRWRNDGQLEFLGRLDAQVKLRGFRIEPGEIESRLRSHAQVREAAVRVRGEGAQARLVAYVVAAGEGDDGLIDALKAHAADTLPAYMQPQAYVVLERLPLTVNGKLDVAALPEPDVQAGGYVAPRTPTEVALAAIWSQVLGREAVGAEDNFFALGGHSLLATRVVSAIARQLDRQVPVRALFEQPVLSQLARWLDGQARQAHAPIPVVDRDGPLPLSFAQQRLWFIDRLEGGSAQYNMPVALRLDGALDVPALQSALDALVARHEVLRTVYAEVDGAAVQVIRPASPVAIAFEDLGALPAAAQAGAVQARVRAEAARPFDLAHDAMLRVSLLRLGEAAHALLLTLHHIASDGWSIGVLVREAMALYAAQVHRQAAALPPLPVQYADYAAWQRARLSGARLEASLDYWRTQLAVLPAVHGLPLDRPRPAQQRFEGAHVEVAVDATVLAGLQALAQRRDATLFMVLHAALSVLLSRWSGETDIVVGTPIAGRVHADVEGLIGFFVNTLVLRADLSGDPAFATVLEQVRETALAAYAHQEVPFELLVDALKPSRSLAHAPLFQILLSLRNNEQVALSLPELAVASLGDGYEQAKFDLQLAATETPDGLRLSWTYATSLFEAATVQRLAGAFARLLAAVAEKDDVAVGALVTGDAGDRLRIDTWNDNKAPTDPLCLHDHVRAHAYERPDAIAVCFEGASLTYRELDRLSDRLADALRSHGVTPGAIVPICLARGLHVPVAILGVMKAGAAYLPLDAAHPDAHLRYVVQDSGAMLVLAHACHAGRLRAFDAPVLELDALLEQQAVADLGRVSSGADDLAYVIYTSGSTGHPKGVLIEHGALSNLLARLSALEVGRRGPGSVWALAASFAFDASLQGLMQLVTGGAIHILPESTKTDAVALRRWLGERGADVIDCTPTLLEYWLGEGLGDCLPDVVVGGEAISPGLWAELVAWQARTGRRAINVYGPTECCVDATWAPVAGEVPVIGRPLGNVRCHVLSPSGQPVPVGAPGELYIGGVAVGRGYWNRPGLTAEKFVADPFEAGGRLYRSGDRVRWRNDGQLEFLGRLDAQVKLRGFRIEPGEIESRLRSHAQVREAAVRVRGEGAQARLVAYVVAAGEGDDGLIDALKAHAADTLPAYMQPQAYVVLERLPLTVNGKLDVAALPEPDVQAGGYVAPRTPTEVALAAIWQSVLQQQSIGRDANFFELGGHSLLAMRVAGEIARTLGKPVPVRALFEHGTLGSLATYIDAQAAEAYAPIPVVDRDGPLPLSFAQQRLWFIDRLEGGSAQYNMPVALRLDGALDVPALQSALDALVARHEVLRTVYAEVDGAAVQVIRPASPVAIAFEDLSALPDANREDTLRRTIEAEASRAFDLARDPMLRVMLLRLADDAHALLFTMHHIASDGWSTGVLVREFAALYGAALRGEAASALPLPVQYADYATWQRERLSGATLERQLSYWRERLAGLPVVHALPLDRPRPMQQRFEAGRVERIVDRRVLQDLHALAGRHDATFFMVLQAALAVLIARWSGESDIVLGTPTAGRVHKDLEPLIGFFVNTLVLRTDLSGDPTFGALLARVRDDAFAAYQHQDLPFEMLVDELKPARSLSHTPLFQILLSMRNNEDVELALPGLTISALGERHEQAKFDLQLSAMEGDDGLRLDWSFATSLFERATIERMAAAFDELLASIASTPDTAVHALPMMSPTDIADAAFRSTGPESTRFRDAALHIQIARQATENPDAPAVRDGRGELTYAQLERAADRLAFRLRAHGCGPGDRIGLHVERSCALLVGLLAVMKTGAAYVVLDPRQGPARLQTIVEDAGLEVVLQSHATMADMAGVHVIDIDDALYVDDPEALSAYPSTPVAVEVDLQSSAYVLYTSGSTGVPKGVEVTHAGLVDYCAFARGGYYAEHLAGSLVATSPAFDLTIPALYVPLLAGGCVELVPVEDELAALAARLDGEVGSVLLRLTPSHVQGLLALSDARPRAQAHVFVVGGEAFPVALAQALQGKYPDARVINHYGPTETVVGCCWYDVSAHLASLAQATSLPIGVPMENTRLYVLDGRGRLVPPGVAGELYIGGAGVAKGYLGRAELTAEKFVADPFEAGGRLYRSGDRVRWRNDGQLEFLGRLDAQVKLRGFRIEPGEIESRLRSHAQVREAAVIVHGEGADARLAAYVVPVSAHVAGDDFPSRLKAHLSEHLPVYMQPQGYMVIERMPLTANGKVDRSALPEPCWRVATHVPAETDTERDLVRIWAGLLGHDDISVEASFFELGGHSLLATRVANTVQRQLGIELPIRSLFEHSDIRSIAQLIDAQRIRQQNLAMAMERNGNVEMEW